METFCLLIKISPFPHPPSPGNHHSTFCIYVSDYFRFHIHVKSCSTCISLSIMSFRFILTIANGKIFIFLRLSNVPLDAYATFSYPFICQWRFRVQFFWLCAQKSMAENSSHDLEDQLACLTDLNSCHTLHPFVSLHSPVIYTNLSSNFPVHFRPS